MRKLLFAVLLTSLAFSEAGAQFSRYIVRFKNKGGSPFTLANPAAYLSSRALDRRTRYGIAVDSTDLPVTPSYISQVISQPNVTLLNVSRWMNAITIRTTNSSSLAAINNLPFVQGTSGIAARNGDGRPVGKSKMEPEEPLPPVMNGNTTARVSADYFNYGTGSYNEIHLHNGEFLHNIGLRGQGMQIAMLDNGFSNYTGLKSFDSINANGQVLGTWDFVNRETNVANDGSHGMNCFSIIGANIPGQFIGKAPKASFWLFKTEDDASEYPIEELNWVCGAERADSAGADVISSSLGYNTFDNPSLDHTYAQMDGNTTIAAIGADLAAKKGLLVFNAAGNEGGGSWRYLITPSDADSILCIGAVSVSGTVGGFSSYGPSSDGQVKPDIASVGVSALIQTTGNTVGTGNGTSFACPNMAGMSTCLWQGFPEYNNMKIISVLRESSHKYATPDNRVGYGIPDLKKAFSQLLTSYATATSSASGCRVTINWSTKDAGTMKYEIERKGPGESVFTKIADVAAQTNVLLGNRSYTYNNDLTAGASGVYAYRIRQIIDTAAASFTGVYVDTTTVTVSNCLITGTTNPGAVTTVLKVVPNPVVSGIASLIIETPFAIPAMTISLYNSEGRLVNQRVDSKTAGRKVVDLPIHTLAAGQYFLRVMQGSKTVGTTTLSVQ